MAAKVYGELCRLVKGKKGSPGEQAVSFTTTVVNHSKKMS